MVKCKICNKEFKSLKSLSIHLRHNYGKNGHPETIQNYYDLFMRQGKNEDICVICGKTTNFVSLKKGYYETCGNSSCAQKNPKTREKMRNIFLKKYGVDNPFKSEECRRKTEKTNLEKYGVKNPMLNPEIQRKAKETSLKKYGTEYPIQSEIIKERRRKNSIAKWGVDNHMKIKEISEKAHRPLIERAKSRVSSKLEELGIEIIEYDKCSSICKLKYKECGHEINIKPATILYDHQYLKCRICNPNIYGRMQSELADFLLKLFPDLTQNDHSVLGNRQEIDILIPEKNIGIEFDGLYWHSESMGTPKKYHQEKTLLAEEKGIQLIHVFEDEWVNKQDIVKSVILAKLGIFDEKVYARKCEISEIPDSLSKEFLNNNHMQGYISCGLNIALFYNDELVSLLNMGKPRFDKKYQWEILRFCNRKNTQIMGGLSKLLKYFERKYVPKSIITYADARYGNGQSYKNCGFSKNGMTGPGYFYLKDGGRYSRYKFQKRMLKDKLEIFDENLSEWENMQLNGFDRIWDCGNHIYAKEYEPIPIEEFESIHIKESEYILNYQI